MSDIEDFPLPSTSRHTEDGGHVPPHIPEWRRNAGTDRVVKGSEVERDQRNRAQFEAHLAEHRRRGEPAKIVDEPLSRVEWKYDDSDKDGPNEFISSARYTKKEAEARRAGLIEEGAYDVRILPAD